MPLFFWPIFVISIGIVIIAVQNSNTLPAIMKFLVDNLKGCTDLCHPGRDRYRNYHQLPILDSNRYQTFHSNEKIKRELKNFETIPSESISFKEGDKIKVP